MSRTGHFQMSGGTGGFSELLALIAEHGGSAEHTAIAVETDKNLLVVALAEAGFTVYPINPRAVARYRERYGQAGGKSPDLGHGSRVCGLATL